MKLTAFTEHFDRFFEERGHPQGGRLPTWTPMNTEGLGDIPTIEASLIPQAKVVTKEDVRKMIAPDGFLVGANGKRLIVHIHSTYRAHEWDVEELPHFHLTGCGTLTDAISKQTDDRFGVKDDAEQYFCLTHKSNRREFKRVLRACINCVAYLNKNYHQRYRDPYTYSAKDFFEEFAGGLPQATKIFKTFTPMDLVEKDYYTSDWSLISQRKRIAHPWCDECEFDNPNIAYYDVHHRNSKARDNRDENLQVLCKACHGKKHPHLRVAYIAKGTLDAYGRMPLAGVTHEK